MLLNLSNHPSANWPEEQISAAVEMFGSVKDLPFPAIPPEASTEEVVKLAESYAEKIRKMLQTKEDAVHIMGELTFVVAMLRLLQDNAIRCVASTTVRSVEETEQGVKQSRFQFVKFREYPLALS
ncbi:hypothetical protein SAMN05443429_1041 [Cruoricaptor ignavus]|uniref:CRISPR-associated protein n=1 Tax=Cruoricaptor ignavus TaxID=1118202 RepID=A0A1M6DJY6_9FLAO|nr:hypothetical protein [Cruoricaptor ignavus]SHI73443.1 hypothetical protein SAMN05443429_1041 [Cruoricaptor ignavus]